MHVGRRIGAPCGVTPACRRRKLVNVPVPITTRNTGGTIPRTPEPMSGPAQAPDDTSIYQLLITLDGIRPAIRRRVLVPAELTLAELHAVIQAAMGWQDYHLWRFDVGGVEYGRPMEDGADFPLADARGVRLDAAAGPGDVFGYEYDFGDSWEHRVRVERVLARAPGRAYPVCVLAERACPPEDCGGVWGYAELLEALGNPKHPEHAEMLEWIGGVFDPESADVAGINRRLAALQRGVGGRRRAQRPSGASGRGRAVRDVGASPIASARGPSADHAPPPDALSDTLSDVLRQLAQAASEQARGQSSPTLDDLNAALATIAGGYNARAQPELGGLSPSAVQRLLEADWASPASALRLDETLTLDELAGARALHDARLLLELLAEGDPVKATPKGNLPRALVTRFRERMREPEGGSHPWDAGRTVWNEEDLGRLHHARVLLEVAGLVQRRKGVFRRTRRGDQLAAAERAGALFARLVRTHFRVFNLAYLDGAGPAPGFQYTVAYMLYRFARVGGEWRAPGELTGALLLPLVQDELAADTSYDRPALVLETRCLRPLEGFGLVDGREAAPEPGELLRRRAYRKTRLFDRLFRFALPGSG
jgi:hypothetical protein